jgi:hypothetical protein
VRRAAKKIGKLLSAGFDYSKFLTEVQKIQDELRQPVTFSDLKETRPADLAIPDKDGLKIKQSQFRGKTTNYITIFGAAGEADIPEPQLKELSDHYKPATRKFFTDTGLRDPIMAPGLDRRADAIFEDGFDLILESAGLVDQNTSTEKTGMEQPTAGQTDTIQPSPNDSQNTITTEMEQARKKLQTWCEDNDILHLMRNMDTVEFCQGKAAALITPGIAALEPAKLPLHIEIITAEDLGNPIVDVGLTRTLAGVKLAFEDKKVARADELVYMTSGKQGLRREGKFQGISKMEPVLYISKILRRIYDLDFSEAVTSAYITKVLFRVRSEGEETEQQSKLTKLIQDFFTHGKIAFAMSDDVEEIKEVQPKVDWAMLNGIEEKLADLELGLVGIPKSIMNRTLNLNRDTATIQAIQFVRFVRKPAEKHLAETFENQLLNPLFAHLIGKKLSEIPFRIKIKRRMPEEGDIDAVFDSITQTKERELLDGKLPQDDAKSTFGAAGESLLVRETKEGYIVSPHKSS